MDYITGNTAQMSQSLQSDTINQMKTLTVKMLTSQTSKFDIQKNLTNIQGGFKFILLNQA